MYTYIYIYMYTRNIPVLEATYVRSPNYRLIMKLVYNIIQIFGIIRK